MINRKLSIELPEGFDPVQFLIDDKNRFLHALAKSCQIANSSIGAEQTVQTIIEAGWAVANMCLLYPVMVRHMPDERSRLYMLAPIHGMNLLSRASFDMPLDEQEKLAEYREEFRDLIDAILRIHSDLVDHLQKTKLSS